jgi:hypothetical protein
VVAAELGEALIEGDGQHVVIVGGRDERAD